MALVVPWAKIDDSFPRHPKVAGLSSKAVHLFVVLICDCARYLTDGVVDKAGMRSAHDAIHHTFTARSRPLSELIENDLVSLSDDGWRIHDFLDYNPSSAQVREKREYDRERQRLHRERLSRRDSPVSHSAPSRPVPKKKEEERKSVTPSTGEARLDDALGLGPSAPDACEPEKIDQAAQPWLDQLERIFGPNDKPGLDE